MRWGYANALGPFELWDALGFEPTARRIALEGRELPESILRMLGRPESGVKSFYRPADADRQPRTEYFDLTAGAYKELEPRPGITVLTDLKRARGVVKTNSGASLIDLGDGVICCEFHSKANSIGDDIMQYGARRPCRTRDQLRCHGHRQSGRELFRRRQSDDGPARRAGTGVGRIGRSHPRRSSRSTCL